MTLILSCITPTFVVQISDRRLIWLDGPHKGKVKDDNANKMIVLCNRLTLAYTGLAEIGSQKTDHWLLDVLAEIKPYNPRKAIEAIAERASRAFRFLQGSPEHKRQAFVVAGWARFSKDGELTPFLSAISNALDDAWNWQDLPQNEFSVRTMPLPVYTPVEVA